MNDNFDFKIVDAEGMEILDVIAESHKFNNWMYETIKPYCTGNVLEIGSGIGNISQFFVDDKFQITLTDIRENYCDRLRQKFKNNTYVNAIQNMDLVADDFEQKYASSLNSYQTVFALNVVEHINDDNLAIANAKKLLKQGGNLIILVPAYQALYNQFDKSLEHYRRYNKTSLNTLFTNNKLAITRSQYFNCAGILGWYVSGKLQKNDSIPAGQMKLYNALVPIFKLVDKVLFNTVGLSVITVAQK